MFKMLFLKEKCELCLKLQDVFNALKSYKPFQKCIYCVALQTFTAPFFQTKASSFNSAASFDGDGNKRRKQPLFLVTETLLKLQSSTFVTHFYISSFQ